MNKYIQIKITLIQLLFDDINSYGTCILCYHEKEVNIWCNGASIAECMFATRYDP